MIFIVICAVVGLMISGVSGAECMGSITVGSLDHDEMIISADHTYILTGYTVQCEGIVTTWEFCYQKHGATAVTFNPGIWEGERIGNSTNYRYSLIQSNTVTFNPSVGSTFSCQNYTLPVAEQFTAPSGSVVGLYSNRGEMRTLLLHTDTTNQQITPYRRGGNKSEVVTSNQNVNYNIAIRAHLGIASTLSTTTTTSSTLMELSTTTTLVASSPTTTITSIISVGTTSMSTTIKMTTTPAAITTTNFMTTSTTTTSAMNMTESSSTIIMSNPTAGQTGSGGSSSSIAPVIAGVVVGVIVCILIVLVIVLLMWYQRKKKREQITEVYDQHKSPEEPLKDKMLINHHYSVIRHEVKHAPDVDGMVTIKNATSADYEAIDNPGYYSSVEHSNNDNKKNEPYSYLEPASTTKDLPKLLSNDYQALPELDAYEKADIPYQYEVATTSVYRNSLDGSILSDGLPDDEQIYEDPGHVKENIYAWFEEKKYRKIKKDDVGILQRLGSGEFGVVHLGTWTDGSADPIQVAVKTLNSKCSESDRVKFLREAAIMGQFQHNNVVQLHGVVTEEENMMIVLEYMSKGDLRELLLSMKTMAPEEIHSEIKHDLLSYCRQIAAGLNYLANKRFVHRDLAARNILVSSDDVCKIADFGMARDMEDDTYYITSGGKIPIKWTAPEAILYKKYSTKSDVWSFACVMYEIWSLGHKPFEELNGREYVEKITTGYRLPPPPGCPRAIYQLMMQCWHPEPRQRPLSGTISKTLQKSDRALLTSSTVVTDDNTSDQQSMILGAPLAAGNQLHLDLQQSYITTKSQTS